ncbi:MAG: cell division topological specificity factor MinE [Anaerolineaceae bacterium]|nr:cell division topological specificity factor MinE [Anaerolineaceae bacterium]
MAAWRSRRSGRSANAAKERLKLVLIHDRTDLTPKAVNNLKNELMEVISRYIAIDPEAVRIAVTQDGREQRLVADIPIKSSTRRKIG